MAIKRRRERTSAGSTLLKRAGSRIRKELMVIMTRGYGVGMPF
jgi:hypothetical protein